MPPLFVVRSPFPRGKLKEYILGDRGFVKAVVDVQKKIMTIGGDLHADGEQVLLQEGSRQEDLWGINLHPEESAERWIEFDSMINIRPQQGNRSRHVEDPALQTEIQSIVTSLIP